MPLRDNFPANSAITRRFNPLKNPDLPPPFCPSAAFRDSSPPDHSVSLFLRPSEHSGTLSDTFSPSPVFRPPAFPLARSLRLCFCARPNPQTLCPVLFRSLRPSVHPRFPTPDRSVSVVSSVRTLRHSLRTLSPCRRLSPLTPPEKRASGSAPLPPLFCLLFLAFSV